MVIISILLVGAMILCAALSMILAVAAMFGGGGPELAIIAGILFMAAYGIGAFLGSQSVEPEPVQIHINVTTPQPAPATFTNPRNLTCTSLNESDPSSGYVCLPATARGAGP